MEKESGIEVHGSLVLEEIEKRNLGKEKRRRQESKRLNRGFVEKMLVNKRKEVASDIENVHGAK